MSQTYQKIEIHFCDCKLHAKRRLLFMRACVKGDTILE